MGKQDEQFHINVSYSSGLYYKKIYDRNAIGQYYKTTTIAKARPS